MNRGWLSPLKVTTLSLSISKNLIKLREVNIITMEKKGNKKYI